jgi:hypothetical protein
MRNRFVASMAVVFMLAVGGVALALALSSNTFAGANYGEAASGATESCCPDGPCCPAGACCAANVCCPTGVCCPTEPCCSGRASPTKSAVESASCCPDGDCCPGGACCPETAGAVKAAVK